MSRIALFDKEPASGLTGLQGLTAPGYDEDVPVVIDAFVLGAKSDGKTQFITHAIRTLDAHAPAGLTGDEKAQNEKILGLVLNAKRPLPEANPDQRVRHYVMRVKPENLYGGLGLVGRTRALARGAWWWTPSVVAQTGLAAGALALIRGGLDVMALAGTAVAGALGTIFSREALRRRFVKGPEVELVFWDVAGEDVYSDRGAGAYHAFLQALVTARRSWAGRHVVAPILICNPLAVGRFAEDSPYARLRMIMPNFAALGRPQPDVLVVVNRWELARAVCAGEREADEDVAVLPIARDAPPVPEGATPAGLDPLPVLRRGVVQRHCVDGEPAEVGNTRFRLIHYDAGLSPSVKEQPWSGWDAAPAEARARFADPGEAGVKQLVEYRYAEGPGALGGEAAAGFYDWLVGLVTRAPELPGVARAEAEPVEQPKPQPQSQTQAMSGPPDTTDAGQTVKMFAPLVAARQAPPPAAPTSSSPPEAAEPAGSEAVTVVENRGGFRSGT